jgi:hypothetical protein
MAPLYVTNVSSCAGFIEEVCRKDMLLLPKCIDTIVTLLSDPNLQVERRVIQVFEMFYYSYIRLLKFKLRIKGLFKILC